ncbi:uncharacterized protein K460DRAFT_397329 [Cucurbitaria berberidis CBS 394.84]|uniref:Uncharacterized protein n=1 Tax=Cucurbitaria berberidis CBS 394.84 TaxID=1168544 RepID=A0A9P4L6P9_9PLEO|nr:uncharacterized protein K460DRAFT_397329 [Cucurbitaria berberidis CBS 394.84]KAF1844191.1 hypothetical protein K460DRAFT_397329 [Cucurbitaria berberidis CBS 394.84]
MPPKEAAGAESTELIAGFTDKECKLLAAAFVSSTGPDKYDYELMSTLTKNTVGSLKKMWPPVKRKAIGAHSSFAAFLGLAGTLAPNGDANSAPAPKATASKKRKAADEILDDADDDKNDLEPKSAANKSGTKKKAPAAKSKPGQKKKKVKKEAPISEDEATVQASENSADGGDGLGEFIFTQSVVDWINKTDECADKEVDEDEA